jgi:uncharacterized protein (UPF0303 family)
MEGNMAAEDDIRIIAGQEAALVFTSLDEDTAFAIGADAREAAKRLGRGIAVGVYLWDRTLFLGTTAGASDSNRRWAERKAGLTRLQMKSSYRVVLERGDKPRMMEPSWAMDIADYAIAGGAFPLTVKGIGVVGAVSVSGLSERQDHEVGRAAICRVLGLDPAKFALPEP